MTTRQNNRRGGLGERLPWATAAEESVLGCCLWDTTDGALFEQVAAAIGPEDLTQRHRRIFEAMQALWDAGQPIELIGLETELARRGDLDKSGGSDYLVGLSHKGTPVHIERYLQEVRDATTARQLTTAAYQLAADGLGDYGSAEQYLARFEETAVSVVNECRRRGSGGVLGPQWQTLEQTSEPWFDEPPPERQWLLWHEANAGSVDPHGVLPLGEVGLFVAAGGVGKTHALVSLALSVATGSNWLDVYEVPNPGKVALLLAEEDRQEVHRRLFYASEAMRFDGYGRPSLNGLHNEDLRRRAVQNIVPVGLSGENVALTDETGEPTRFAGELHSKLANGGPWSLVILDPLSRFGGLGMEKDNAVATRVIQCLERYTRAPGTPTVLAAHHENKVAKGQRNKPRSMVEATSGARGSSAITDGGRWAAVLQNCRMPDGWQGVQDFAGSEDLLRFQVTKSNYGPTGESRLLWRPRSCEGAIAAAPPKVVQAYAEAKRNEDRSGRKGTSNGPTPAPRGPLTEADVPPELRNRT